MRGEIARGESLATYPRESAVGVRSGAIERHRSNHAEFRVFDRVRRPAPLDDQICIAIFAR